MDSTDAFGRPRSWNLHSVIGDRLSMQGSRSSVHRTRRTVEQWGKPRSPVSRYAINRHHRNRRLSSSPLYHKRAPLASSSIVVDGNFKGLRMVIGQPFLVSQQNTPDSQRQQSSVTAAAQGKRCHTPAVEYIDANRSGGRTLSDNQYAERSSAVRPGLPTDTVEHGSSVKLCTDYRLRRNREQERDRHPFHHRYHHSHHYSQPYPESCTHSPSHTPPATESRNFIGTEILVRTPNDPMLQAQSLFDIDADPSVDIGRTFHEVFYTPDRPVGHDRRKMQTSQHEGEQLEMQCPSSFELTPISLFFPSPSTDRCNTQSSMNAQSRNACTRLPRNDTVADPTNEKNDPTMSGGTDADDETRLTDKHHEQWNERYMELIRFKCQHGHCKVPMNSKGSLKLAQWVKRQRWLYKIRQSGKPSSLTDERFRMLEEIRFVWRAHDFQWEQRLQECKAFVKEHGHCSIPVQYKNSKLALWAKSQRGQYRMYKKGLQCSLTASRIEALNQIGFVWSPRSK